tara:strand:+ start:1444 stop:3843 length:2400 start_codon:yes stop_codon:yes gene_type:complete
MAGQIKYIKVSRIDGNGVNITNTLETLSTLVIPSGSDNVPFQIESATRFSDYYLYYVTPSINFNFSPAITSSVNYNLLITPKSSNGIPSVQYGTPSPVSFGTINSDPLGLLSSTTSSVNSSAGSLVYFQPQTDFQNNNQVYIKLQGTASVDGSGGSGLFEFVKGNLSDFNAGSGTQIGTNVFMNPNASASLDMEINTTINFGEVIYLRVREGGNNFNVTTLTFSPETFLQITGSSNGVAKQDLPLEPFFSIPFENSDSNVLAGNASQPVSNPFLQDVDYGKGTITPVNNAALISGSATRGTIPESYYTSLAQTNIRYNGSKVQSSDFNVYNPSAGRTDFGDPINIGTYGKTPSVSLNQSLVAYCDWIGGTTPELNNKSAAHIKYLINENGDAISPNLSNITITDIQNNFATGKNIEISLIDPAAGSGMQVLNGNKEIIRGGYRVEPILYSQIPQPPFSSSITMETSSLLPVTDVRTLINLSGNNQNLPAGSTTTILYNQEVFDKPNAFTPSTGKYEIQSSVIESGVDLIFTINFVVQTTGSSPPGGRVIIRLFNETQNTLVAYDSMKTVMASNNGGIISSQDIVFGGLGSIPGIGPITATIPNTDLVENDIIKVTVQVDTEFNMLSNYSSFDVNQLPSATTDSFLNATGSFWGYSGSSFNVISSSQPALSQNYGILKQKAIPNSGFNRPQDIFIIEPGDQFRFQDDENRVFNVVSVSSPDQNPEGKIFVTLDKNVSTLLNKDYFLIRRFVDDGSYIIFDENKPAGGSGAAFIKPRFTTDILNKDVDQFIQDLKSKNLLT